MSAEHGIPLDHVKGWPREYVAKLKESWVTTAEQLVAMAATEGGLTAVASQLGVPEKEMRRLVDLARTALPARVAAELDQPADTSQFGLGALFPRKATPTD